MLTLQFHLPLCQGHFISDTWNYLKFPECTMLVVTTSVLYILCLLTFPIVFIKTTTYLSNIDLKAPSSESLPECFSSFINSTLHTPFNDIYNFVVLISSSIFLIGNPPELNQVPRMQKPLKNYWLHGKSLWMYAINLNQVFICLFCHSLNPEIGDCSKHYSFSHGPSAVFASLILNR